MKLKDLLAEGMDDAPESGVREKEGECEGCGAVCDIRSKLCDGCEMGGADSCPGCGRGPGDGYGADCDDPQGCGYWKDFAREAMAELRAEMKMDRGMDEGVNMFGDFMDKTLELEEQRRVNNARPVVQESYGHSIQRRFQELPQNRIRVVRK